MFLKSSWNSPCRINLRACKYKNVWESPQRLLCGPTVYSVAKWLTSNKVCILIEVNVGCLVIKTVECGDEWWYGLKPISLNHVYWTMLSINTFTSDTHLKALNETNLIPISSHHPHTTHAHTVTGRTTIQAVLHGYSTWWQPSSHSQCSVQHSWRPTP